MSFGIFVCPDTNIFLKFAYPIFLWYTTQVMPGKPAIDNTITEEDILHDQ